MNYTHNVGKFVRCDHRFLGSPQLTLSSLGYHEATPESGVGGRGGGSRTAKG